MLLLCVRFKVVATDDIYHLDFHAADVMQEVFQQGPLCRDSLESLLRCSVCSYLNLGLGHRVSTSPSAPTQSQTRVTLWLYWWRWTIVHVDVSSLTGPIPRVGTSGQATLFFLFFFF